MGLGKVDPIEICIFDHDHTLKGDSFHSNTRKPATWQICTGILLMDSTPGVAVPRPGQSAPHTAILH